MALFRSLLSITAAALLDCAVANFLPLINVTSVVVPSSAQLKPGCWQSRSLGAVVRGVFYFAPTAGSAPNVVSYDPTTRTWDSIPISGAGAAVIKSLAGSTMAGVESVQPGVPDYLVFAGGVGSNAVTQYNFATKAWTTQQSRLSHVTDNLCSSGCLGFAFFATGDFKEQTQTTDTPNAYKPSDRQIQRYNLTSGQMEENNMEKTRAGATCACYKGLPTPSGSPIPGGSRVFFAGGQDDSGPTSSVEMWLPAPNIKRRGEPEFEMSFSGRDRGGLVCGGQLVLAGGRGITKAAAELPTTRTSKRRRSPPKPHPPAAKLMDFVDVRPANFWCFHFDCELVPT
jgi:hypothetical protein